MSVDGHIKPRGSAREGSLRRWCGGRFVVGPAWLPFASVIIVIAAITALFFVFE